MPVNPHPNSLAYSSAQMMADFRKLEEIHSSRKPGDPPTEENMVFIRAMVKRLPEQLASQVRPVLAKLEEEYVRLN